MATVSIVLNDAPLAQYIPPETKRRIKKAARELEYQPNVFASSLRSQRSHTVGVIVFDIADPYCTQILRGIEDALYDSPFVPIVMDIQNSRERFHRQLQVLKGRRVEGLVALANSLSLEANLLAKLESDRAPTVIVGRQLEADSMNSVVTDNAAGARAALEHLYSLGHRRIAFIRGPRALIDSRERWQGLSAFAAEAGLAIDKNLVVELKNPNTSYEEGRKAALELLRRGKPFTALMVFDDMTAFGAIRALSSKGLVAPRDCSVIGFDDLAASAFYNPQLTTVRQPMETLGSTAVRMLIGAIQAAVAKKERAPIHKKIVPVLVKRESTAPPGGQTPQAVSSEAGSSRASKKRGGA